MSKEMFIEAIRFATDRHQDQKRKMDVLPYILHPMEVASIAGSMNPDDELMISGILHDVVEDAGVELETIREKFGERVYMLVESETENKREDQAAELTWKVRKQESLDELRSATDIDIKRLWLADKLSNIRSLWRAYLKEGDAAFEKFHQKDKKEQEWYYRSVLDAVSGLKDTAAYLEFSALVNYIFKPSEN